MITSIQEVFDVVWQKFVVEKEPKSFGAAPGEKYPRCWYRHPDGKRRCFVGWTIPDDKYSPTIEGVSACSLVDVEVGGEPFMSLGIFAVSVDKVMLSALQGLHDTTDDDEHWHAEVERKLREFAEGHGLAIPA